MRLPWDEWEASNQEIEKVASKLSLLIAMTAKNLALYYKYNSTR
ncbi:hypothetical protein NSTCB13_04289 [Nostoc sp. DSM 114160]|jgi:hypothetical protein